MDMKLGRGMRKEGKEEGKEDVGVIIHFTPKALFIQPYVYEFNLVPLAYCYP